MVDLNNQQTDHHGAEHIRGAELCDGDGDRLEVDGVTHTQEHQQGAQHIIDAIHFVGLRELIRYTAHDEHRDNADRHVIGNHENRRVRRSPCLPGKQEVGEDVAAREPNRRRRNGEQAGETADDGNGDHDGHAVADGSQILLLRDLHADRHDGAFHDCLELIHDGLLWCSGLTHGGPSFLSLLQTMWAHGQYVRRMYTNLNDHSTLLPFTGIFIR